MIRKTWIAGAVCAALLPLAALAQGDAHFHGGMHGGASALLSGVTLTSEQQTQVASIRQSAWTTAKPLMQQLHSTEQQIQTLLLTPGAVNTTQLNTLEQTASGLRSQLQDQRLSVELQIRGVLTASQLTQAASTHSQLEALHEQEHSLMHAGAQNSTAQ
jgi:protein CpxP